MPELSGKRVVAVVGERFEDREALVPIDFLKEQGAEVTVVGLEIKELHALHGASLQVDRTFEEADPRAFDAMLIPGGKSPAHLREHPDAVDFVRRFHDTGRLMAAICHGAQLLAAAGLVDGLRLTGWPGIREEMEQAGADFRDEPVVEDGNIVTSRYPEDLPRFDETVKRLLQAA